MNITWHRKFVLIIMGALFVGSATPQVPKPQHASGSQMSVLVRMV